MSVLFDGPNKAPKVDNYDLARGLAEDQAREPVDISQFQVPDPEFQHVIKWASEPLSKGGVQPGDIDPSLGEIMRAAFQQENTVGSFLAQSRVDASDDTPALTPAELYTRITNDGLLPFADNFSGARTEGEYEARKANVRRELKNRQIIDAAGWGGTIATLGAAVADPMNAIPVGGAAVRVAKLASRGRVAALEGALAGGMGAGLAEVGLQATQETRTAAESVTAIAAGTVLGGALGFAVDTVFGREIADKAAKHYDDVRTGKSTSAGAAAVGDLDNVLETRFADDAKLNSLGVNASLEMFEKIPVIGKHLASPARVLSRSYSGAARRAMAMLVSDPSISKANAAGRRSADNVEAAFGAVKGEWGQARSEVNDLYQRNRDAYGKSRETFNTRVAKALAHGDKSPDGDDVAAQAAKIIRARVYEPIKAALIENNVFTREEAELLNAESYFPLVYSPDGVRGDEDAFLEFHEAAFARVIHEDARQALIESETRKSNIEDEVITHKGVRQLVPKVDENGAPVINPKTGRQVMSEKIVAKGKVRELREIARQTFKAEEKELNVEHKSVIRAFNQNNSATQAATESADDGAAQFHAAMSEQLGKNTYAPFEGLHQADAVGMRQTGIILTPDGKLYRGSHEQLFTDIEEGKFGARGGDYGKRILAMTVFEKADGSVSIGFSKPMEADGTAITKEQLGQVRRFVKDTGIDQRRLFFHVTNENRFEILNAHEEDVPWFLEQGRFSPFSRLQTSGMVANPIRKVEARPSVERPDQFAKQFEARDKIREKQAKIEEDLKTKKEDENFKLDLRLEQIRERSKAKVEAGVAKNTGQAVAHGQGLEKELATARKETRSTIRDLEAKAKKQKAPLDKDIDDLAKEIDAHYGERIAEARKAQDEVINAAEDTAYAAILKARGVELTEGYRAILSKYTRNGMHSEELISKEARQRARHLYDNIVNSTDPLLEHEAATGLRGYTKTRKNPADHIQLMDKGWALSDAMAITERYTKTAGMDSVIGKFFKKQAVKLDETGAKVFGPDDKVEMIDVADIGLTEIKRKIKDEYDAMLSKAVPSDVVAKLEKKYRNDASRLETELKAAKVKYEKELNARRDTEIEALDTLLNFARGRSPNSPTQRLRETAEVVGIFNYIRLMGGQIVSSLGDPLNLVISQGLGNTVRHGIVPILKDFKAALRSADGEARRLARLSGANLEMEFNTTMAEIGGFTNPWVSRDKMQVWRTAAEKFSTVNGIKYWNTLWKQVAYNTTQARLIDDAVKGWGKLSEPERAWIANLGVDANRLNDFRAYFGNQSSKTVAGGMPLARWDEWADKATGEAFRAAVYKESFNVVITPGLYDRLNAHSDPVGRMILQFRNHMFANTARLTARNAQLARLGMDKAATAMTGFVGLIMMGALIDAMKQTLGDVTITGDTVSGEDTLDTIISRWQEAPAQSLYNSLDRAGWVGPVFEASNILHSTSGAGLQDMLRLMAGEEHTGSSRVGSRSMLDVAGGASAGALSDIIMSARAGVSAALDDEKDLTLGDVKRMERLGLPMTLPYLRPLINEFNQFVGTQYDWPMGR